MRQMPWIVGVLIFSACRCRERRAAAVEHLVRVVAAAQVGGELVELVDEHDLHAGALQARRAAGVLDVELAAGEVLELAPVRAVAAGGARQQRAHAGVSSSIGLSFCATTCSSRLRPAARP
jgi:hypothetical protein